VSDIRTQWDYTSKSAKMDGSSLGLNLMQHNLSSADLTSLSELKLKISKVMLLPKTKAMYM